MKIHFSVLQKWNAIGKNYISKYDRKFGVDNLLLKCSNLNGLVLNMPSFYKVILNTWCDLQKKKKVNSKEKILSQNIFGNHNIAKNKQSLFFANWSKCNIVLVSDIWNIDTNNWKDSTEILDKLRIKRNWISEYNKIKDYFSNEWKQILRDQPIVQNTDLVHFGKEIELNSSEVLCQSKIIDFHKVKQKDLYYILLYPVPTPTCVLKWNEILETDYSIDELFHEKRHFMYNRKMYNFHWKLLHRIIFSEMKLRLMNKSDGKCKICKREKESIKHLIFECSEITLLWAKIEDFISETLDFHVDINLNNVVIGVNSDVCNGDMYVKIYINFVILNTKWLIWKNRNDVKYNNTISKNANELFNCSVKQCQSEAKLIVSSMYNSRLHPNLKIMLNDLIDN